jgi:hypothetical protein
MQKFAHAGANGTWYVLDLLNVMSAGPSADVRCLAAASILGEMSQA